MKREKNDLDRYFRDCSEPVRGLNNVRVSVIDNPYEIENFKNTKCGIKCGIYIAIAKSGKYFTPIYIGCSKNINKRIHDHSCISWDCVIVFHIDMDQYTEDSVLNAESNLILWSLVGDRFLALNRKFSYKHLVDYSGLFDGISGWLCENNLNFMDDEFIEDGINYREVDLIGINQGERDYEVLKYGTAILHFSVPEQNLNNSHTIILHASSTCSDIYKSVDAPTLFNPAIIERVSNHMACYGITKSADNKFRLNKDLEFRSLSAAMSILAAEEFDEWYSWFHCIWHPFKSSKLNDDMVMNSNVFQKYIINYYCDLDLDYFIKRPTLEPQEEQLLNYLKTKKR